jgi:hypothetical protein
VVDDESGHVTNAPRPGFGWAGPRAGAKDDRVDPQPAGRGNDLLFGATAGNKWLETRGWHCRGKSVSPKRQERGRGLVVRVCETPLDCVPAGQRPGPSAERRIGTGQLPGPALHDVQQCDNGGFAGPDHLLHAPGQGLILGPFQGNEEATGFVHSPLTTPLRGLTPRPARQRS